MPFVKLAELKGIPLALTADEPPYSHWTTKCAQAEEEVKGTKNKPGFIDSSINQPLYSKIIGTVCKFFGRNCFYTLRLARKMRNFIVPLIKNIIDCCYFHR